MTKVHQAIMDETGSESNVADQDTMSDDNRPVAPPRPTRSQRRGGRRGQATTKHAQPKPKLQSGTVGRSNTENAKVTLRVAKMQRRPLTKHEKQLVAGAQGTLARRANEGKTRAKRKASRAARRKNR